MNGRISPHQVKMQSFWSRCGWAVILLGLLVWGCGGPSRQIQPEQLKAQVDVLGQKNALQDQLLAQAGRDTLTNYRDYIVGPEDLLEVSFLGADDLNREVRVNGQGDISLPLAGDVKVAGISADEVEKRLRQLYQEKEFLINPQITVRVKEYRNQRVMVTGAVVRPGSYELIGPRTLLEMLGKAGGIQSTAGEMVHIIRAQSAPGLKKTLKGAPPKSFAPGTETIVIDLRRLLTKGGIELNLPIENGDIIHVPLAQSVYVLGAVSKPGSVLAKDNLTATQAVAMAGGLSPQLFSNNVTILRLDETGNPTTIPLNLAQVTKGAEPDIILKANDIVFVKESVFRRFFYDFKNMFPGSVGVGSTIPF